MSWGVGYWFIGLMVEEFNSLLVELLNGLLGYLFLFVIPSDRRESRDLVLLRRNIF